MGGQPFVVADAPAVFHDPPEGALDDPAAGQALAPGFDPGSAHGRAVLDRIVVPGTPSVARVRMLERLEMFTDARVEQYWQLLAIINGQRPPRPGCLPSNG
jgi:hypothetical protein